MIPVAEQSDIDGAAVLAVAAGAAVHIAPVLLARVAARREQALAALAEGQPVYGVTTGMGALSGTRLGLEEQADHSRRLMLARGRGGRHGSPGRRPAR